MKGGEGELEREGKYSKISHAFHVSPKKNGSRMCTNDRPSQAWNEYKYFTRIVFKCIHYDMTSNGNA